MHYHRIILAYERKQCVELRPADILAGCLVGKDLDFPIAFKREKSKPPQKKLTPKADFASNRINNSNDIRCLIGLFERFEVAIFGFSFSSTHNAPIEKGKEMYIAYADAEYRVLFEKSHFTRRGIQFSAVLMEPIAPGAISTPTSYPYTNRCSESAISGPGVEGAEPEVRQVPIVSHNPSSQVIEYKREIDGAIRSVKGSIHAMAPPQPDTADSHAPGSSTRPLLLGYDAEWYVRPGDERRTPLMQQISFRAGDGREYVWLLDYVRTGNTRIAMTTFLRWFFEDTGDLVGYDFLSKETYSITLAGHYDIVDLTIFFDGRDILSMTDSIRRTLATVEKPITKKLWNSGRNNERKLIIHIRDTMLLSPAGSSLEKLGKALKIPKMDLPDGYDKSEMDRLRREQRDAFMVYAARDAEICRLWIEQMTDGYNQKIDITLGAQAAKALRKAVMEENGWTTTKEFDSHFRGIATVTEQSYNPDEHRPRGRTVKIVRPEAAFLLEAGTQSYYGGRNECYIFGIHHSDTGWYDFDLCGAYATAMTLIPDPDFDKAGTPITVLDTSLFFPFSYLFAYIEFEFPTSIFYPSLPVRDPLGRGLIFPRTGRTWASAPELWVALHQGCKICCVGPAILQPVKPKRSLGVGVKQLAVARQAAKDMHGKGSPQELAAKDRTNGGYGKTAQGVAGKRAYSTRYDEVRDIPASCITSSPMAALSSGLPRAVLSAALQQVHERGYRIASATTDGFLTDAPLAVLEDCDLYGLREYYRQARRYMVGDPHIWELKHASSSLVMLKTRGGFGVGEIDSHALPVAGAGYKPTGDVKDRIEEIGRPTALAEHFLQRDGLIGVEFHALPSPRAYVKSKADGIGETQRRKISWEFDYKRRPIPDSVRMESIEIDGRVYEHLTYETTPWEAHTDFDDARAATLRVKEPDKTIETHENIEKRIARRGAKSGVRARGGMDRSGAVSVLRGLRSGRLLAPWYEHGVTTGPDVCARVGKIFGVTLTPNDWKHAGRRERWEKVLFVGMAAEMDALDLKPHTQHLVTPAPAPGQKI